MDFESVFTYVWSNPLVWFLHRMGFLGFNPSVWAYFAALLWGARRAVTSCQAQGQPGTVLKPLALSLAIITVTWFYIIRFIFAYEDEATKAGAAPSSHGGPSAYYGNGWFTDAYVDVLRPGPFGLCSQLLGWTAVVSVWQRHADVGFFLYGMLGAMSAAFSTVALGGAGGVAGALGAHAGRKGRRGSGSPRISAAFLPVLLTIAYSAYRQAATVEDCLPPVLRGRSLVDASRDESCRPFQFWLVLMHFLVLVPKLLQKWSDCVLPDWRWRDPRRPELDGWLFCYLLHAPEVDAGLFWLVSAVGLWTGHWWSVGIPAHRTAGAGWFYPMPVSDCQKSISIDLLCASLLTVFLIYRELRTSAFLQSLDEEIYRRLPSALSSRSWLKARTVAWWPEGHSPLAAAYSLTLLLAMAVLTPGVVLALHLAAASFFDPVAGSHARQVTWAQERCARWMGGRGAGPSGAAGAGAARWMNMGIVGESQKKDESSDCSAPVGTCGLLPGSISCRVDFPASCQALALHLGRKLGIYGESVLACGCGPGAELATWMKLGAKHVTGIDTNAEFAAGWTVAAIKMRDSMNGDGGRAQDSGAAGKIGLDSHPCVSGLASAVNAAEEGAKEAKKPAPRIPSVNERFLHMGVEDIGSSHLFSEGLFSRVIVLDAVYHFADKPQFFQDCAGKLVCSKLGMTDILLKDGVEAPWWARVMLRLCGVQGRVMTKQEYVQALSRAGFGEIEIEVIPSYFAPSQTFLKELQGAYIWGACAARLVSSLSKCLDYAVIIAEPRMKPRPRCSVAVIGSGVAGLTCAAELQRLCDVTVFEAKPKAALGSHGAMRVCGRTCDVPLRMIGPAYYETLMRVVGELQVPSARLNETYADWSLDDELKAVCNHVECPPAMQTQGPGTGNPLMRKQMVSVAAETECAGLGSGGDEAVDSPSSVDKLSPHSHEQEKEARPFASTEKPSSWRHRELPEPIKSFMKFLSLFLDLVRVVTGCESFADLRRAAGLGMDWNMFRHSAGMLLRFTVVQLLHGWLLPGDAGLSFEQFLLTYGFFSREELGLLRHEAISGGTACAAGGAVRAAAAGDGASSKARTARNVLGGVSWMLSTTREGALRMPASYLNPYLLKLLWGGWVPWGHGGWRRIAPSMTSLEAALSYNVELRFNSRVVVERTLEGSHGSPRGPTAGRFRVQVLDAGSATSERETAHARCFDFVVVATDPMSVEHILCAELGSSLPESALALFERYPLSRSLAAVHTDVRLMPPRREDWSLFNVYHEPKGLRKASGLLRLPAAVQPSESKPRPVGTMLQPHGGMQTLARMRGRQRDASALLAESSAVARRAQSRRPTSELLPTQLCQGRPVRSNTLAPELFAKLLTAAAALAFAISVALAQAAWGLDAPDCIDVESASAKDLENLKGIGPALSKRIIEFRKGERTNAAKDGRKTWNFGKWATLMRVDGISQQACTANISQVCFGGKVQKACPMPK